MTDTDTNRLARATEQAMRKIRSDAEIPAGCPAALGPGGAPGGDITTKIISLPVAKAAALVLCLCGLGWSGAEGYFRLQAVEKRAEAAMVASAAAEKRAEAAEQAAAAKAAEVLAKLGEINANTEALRRQSQAIEAQLAELRSALLRRAAP